MTTTTPKYDDAIDNCAGMPGCGDQRALFQWYGDLHAACPRCYANTFGGPPDPTFPIVAVVTATCGACGQRFTYTEDPEVTREWGERIVCGRCSADIESCINCLAIVPLDATAYAVDGAVLCGPCGVRRYGDKAEDYRIA